MARRKTFVCRWFCEKCGVYYNPPGKIQEFTCPKCNSKTRPKTIEKSLVAPQDKGCLVDIMMRDNPRLSWSLGCNENELPRMQKIHPGAEFRKAKGGGYQMVIHNRAEKLRRMKEAGMEEY